MRGKARNAVNRWKDWYDQGVRDLSRAELDVEHQYFEWACFTAQQAAELLSILSAKIDIRTDSLRGNPPLISIKKSGGSSECDT